MISKHYVLPVVALGAVIAGCSPRSVPGALPSSSPASASAEEAPVAHVTTSLDSDPPLPSEPKEGWPGFQSSKDSSDTGHVHDRDKGGTIYSCPMHPEVVSDKPGKCPRCGMALEKKK